MVSVKNQFDLRYVPFEELVDPENLVTMVRYIKTDSDFHQQARYRNRKSTKYDPRFDAYKKSWRQSSSSSFFIFCCRFYSVPLVE